MEAVIYARFSTLDQKKGDSLRFQLDRCRALIAQKQWESGPELIDRGRSAFTGVNRSEFAELGLFEAQVEKGHHRGRVLVVERLDRLSRQGTEETLGLVWKLVNNGVGVATVDDSEFYPAHTKLPTNKLLAILIKSEMALEESAKKSVRLASLWEKKRGEAVNTGKAMTARAPAWLAVDKATGRFVEVPERGAIVRRIFKRVVEGVGTHSLAAELNRDGIASFGSGKAGWRHTYIRLILENRAVLGERQHHRNLPDGGSEPVGEVQTDYYPRVVDASLFERAQAVRADRRGNAGRKGLTFTNLLTGIVHCTECGSIVTASSKTRAGSTRMRRGKLVTVGTDSVYLLCDSVKRGRCENRVRVNYLRLERGLLDAMLHLALDDAHFSRRDDTFQFEELSAQTRLEIEDLKSRRKRISDAIESGEDDEEMRDRRRGLTQKIEEATARLANAERQLVEARGKVSANEHLKRVHNIRAALNDPDPEIRLDARRRVHLALKGVIEHAWMGTEKTVTFVFVGGLAAIEIDTYGNIANANSNVLAMTAGGLANHEVEALPPLERARADALLRRAKSPVSV